MEKMCSGKFRKKVLAPDWDTAYYVWHTECGRRQAVRHLPPEQVFTGSSPAARSSESNVSPSLYAKGGEIFFCAFLIEGRTDGTLEPIPPYNRKET